MLAVDEKMVLVQQYYHLLLGRVLLLLNVLYSIPRFSSMCCDVSSQPLPNLLQTRAIVLGENRTPNRCRCMFRKQKRQANNHGAPLKLLHFP
jgi:hypothetical protein